MTTGKLDRVQYDNGSGKTHRKLITRVSNLLLLATFVLGAVIVSALLLRSSAQQGAVLSINPSISYQTMTGWEATVGGDWRDNPGIAHNWNAQALDMGVEIGLNRVRLPVWSYAENTTDYFQQYLNGSITRIQANSFRGTVGNDNNNPNNLNTSGFIWTELDYFVDNIVNPIRNRLAARGETLYVNAMYHGNPPTHKSNPAEYGEFVLATYQHLQAKYGWIPDAWTISLEPNNEGWSATEIGNSLVAAGDRLAANGLSSNIHMIAPDCSNTSTSVSQYNTIRAIPGVFNYLKTIAWHNYQGAGAASQKNYMRDEALNHRIQTGMHEHIGADYLELHEDIVEGGVSSWQQFTWTGYQTNDIGGKYLIADAANPQSPVVLGSRTKFLRQYFKYVRFGAKRVEATSTDDGFDPLAFINRDGKYVVVIKAERGGSFSIRDLPPGTYGIKYTTTSQYDVDAADQTMTSGQVLMANIPDRGVITVYAKASTGGPPAPAGRAVIDRCKLKQSTDGTFTLLVYGANIESGASVAVGQQIPRKVKFQGNVSPGVYTRLKLKGSFCEGLPGSIIVTNPGAQPSAPFNCNSTCQ